MRHLPHNTIQVFSLIFSFFLKFYFFSPRGASMPTRVGDGHWWFFELSRLLLLSLMLLRKMKDFAYDFKTVLEICATSRFAIYAIQCTGTSGNFICNIDFLSVLVSRCKELASPEPAPPAFDCSVGPLRIRDVKQSVSICAVFPEVSSCKYRYFWYYSLGSK